MVLHVYHASIGNKEFQFNLEMNALTQETFELDLAAALEEVSETMLSHLRVKRTSDDREEDAQCCACRAAPATRLIHHTMLFSDGFPPRVEDLPQPVCAASECETRAKAQFLMDMEVAASALTHSSASPRSSTGPGCFYCKRTSAREAGKTGLMRCSKCKVAKYCCAECQRNDWKAHKLVCRADAGVVSAADAS